MSNFNPAQRQVDVTGYWDKVDRKNGGDGLVWAKSMAKAGQQVIVHIEGPNKQHYKVPPIRAGDPVCLSQFAPLEVLRDSGDLNQCATGAMSKDNLPLIKLMTTPEANVFFEKKAKTLKRTKDQLMQDAAIRQQREASGAARPLSRNEVDTSLKLEDAVVSIDEVINPFIEHLCAQIRPDLEPNNRMSASDFMASMLDIEESLTFDEAEYIYTHSAVYPSVRSWAARKKDQLWAETAPAAGIVDDLADAPEPVDESDLGQFADDEASDASDSPVAASPRKGRPKRNQ
jgi:hypothetical protein